ncbi:MAG TPA: glucose-1-phosphate adenylyltransferase [Thermomicrobiales bacterium]|nr:glucose-1-phosphate adenylyltransferase [Thermomicrobiales bacterium]
MSVERDKTVAMILAGGQGERLSVLSRQRAKPAVMFAGKYRIIDFTLSNCVNSGIFDIAVLTQYRPHSLNDHIGHGRPWDLDRATGGLKLLQPYLGRARSDWYRGTADAIYHNLFYVEESRATDVLILSGDHVYAMDYRPMMAVHRESGADVTVAVQPVPWSDASRFGVIDVDAAGKVINFEEKPAEPKSNLASMGVYIFRADILLDVFRRDDIGRSMIDFGHEVIPFLIADENAHAYRFDRYWRDVGTLQSYWDANMDQIQDVPGLNLYDPDWRIHTRSEERPPAKVMDGSQVSRSLLSHGSIVIRATVERSILSPGVVLQDGCVVRDSIVMTDAVIGPGVVLDRCIIDKHVQIGKGAHLGVGDDHAVNWLEPSRLNTGLTLVGRSARIPAGVSVGRNVVIGADVTEAAFESRDIASGETVDLQAPVWA